MKFTKGQLVLISSGEYSDYEVMELVRVVVDFDAADALRKYLVLHPIERTEYNANFNKVLTYLLAADLIEQVEYAEFYFGAYSFSERTFGNFGLIPYEPRRSDRDIVATGMPEKTK